jgi:predicted permease
MTRLREWMHRFWGTVRRRRNDLDLEEELKLHLELEAEELRRRKGATEDAGRLARVKAGGMAQSMEALRDQRGLPWLDDFARDLRHGLRQLRRTPAFTTVALLTLALGIGANTAIFSIVNGAVLRPLAYPKPEQLMYLSASGQGGGRYPVSPPEYYEFRAFNQSFADVGIVQMGAVNLTAGDRPLRVQSASVDGHLLAALGIEPALGRLFAGAETEVTGPWFPGNPGNMQPPRIAILSHELWQSAFAGLPVIGETIEVDGVRREVIGVMPPGADILDNRTQIWLPLGLNPANRNFRGWHVLHLVGRLKDGVTIDAARAELNGLIETWAERVGLPQGSGVFTPLGRPFAHILQIDPIQDVILGSGSRSIWVLQAAVGLVLLIACANLANLLLARAETRQREYAVRAALGAGRSRLVRQFITEAVLLSIAGGVLGLLFANIGVRALLRAYPTTLPRMHEVTVDPYVLLFTFGVSVATGLLFGLAPLARTRMRTLAAALTEAGTRGIIGSARHHIRGGLVVAEIALAVMLVIGAGLLMRTVYNLISVDAGFDRSRLVTFSITAPFASYPESTRGQMYQRLLTELRALPGVQSATAASGLPPARPPDGEDGFIEGYLSPDGDPTPGVDQYQSVMTDYFETMGIPIVQGRSFQPADAASAGLVAIVNESFVNKFWKGLDPIGRRLRPGWAKPWFTVVGVAKDVKQAGLDRNVGTEFYFFVDQMAYAPSPVGRSPITINIVLRTSLPPEALSEPVERLVTQVDASIPVVGLREMDEVFSESIRRPRLLAELVGAFAGLSLVLAAIGAYGVLSYVVAQRRREIGIRLALGAGRSGVLAHVMKEGLMLTVAGVIIGLFGALILNRLMASLLFGVQPTDTATLAAATGTIMLVAAVACWLPARRASRLDPNLTLRDE